jgi:hypothetical protein
MDDDVRAFLKRYTPVSDAFIDDFFSLYSLESRPGDFVVDLATTATWLRVKKGNLKRLLLNSFQEGLDFRVLCISRDEEIELSRGKGRLETILMTSDCFKMLCMQSRTPKAAEVRAYYVAVEAALFRYREDIIESLNRRIGTLERNQRPKSSKADRDGGGLIYVIKASENLDSVYKIGRTQDLAGRLRSHSSAAADDLDIVFIYRTRCVQEVESCLKSFLKKNQYRRRKEVFQLDLAMIKDVIASCDRTCMLQTLYKRPRRSKQTGGYYAVLVPT